MDILSRHRPLPLKVLTLSARLVPWLIALVVLAFVAAWLVLQLFIVPGIGELRGELESRAGRALGVPVRIGAITAHADAVFPSFEVQDVSLLDAQGRVALRLPRVLLTLSPRSLWNLGFEQVVIDRPELEVRRAGDGRVYVAGIEISQEQEGDHRAANWIFSQTEWIIQGGRVRWSDETRAAPPLELAQVELRLRNAARSHELRMDATPPAELGSRVSLRGRFRQPLLSSDAGQWRRWRGELYAISERVDVARLRHHLPLKLDVSGGAGALRAWIDVDQGRVLAVTADVALSRVRVRPGADLAVPDLKFLSGRLAGRVLEGGMEISAKGLRFETSDGLQWHGGDVRVSHAVGEEASAAQGEVDASDVDLNTLVRLARRLPLEQHVLDALQGYAPKGKIEQLHARWRGDWRSPRQFDARGRLRNIEIAAGVPATDPAGGVSRTDAVGTPGVRGLGVDFDLTQDGGRASVTVQQGHLELPGVFEQPRVALDRFAAEARWKQQGERLTVQVANARFSNADAQGEAQFKWTNAPASEAQGHPGLPGVIDLQGSLGRAEVAAVHRYLPLAVPAEVRDYLRQALARGQGGGVRFRVKGDLRDFPYAQAGQGEFRITAHLQDVDFNYVPASLQPEGQAPWPALASLNGDLLIDHASLQLRNVSARLAQAPAIRVSRGEARIADLTHDVRVETGMQVEGPLDDLLRVLLRGSPLDALLGGVFAQARGEGGVQAQFNLQVPIARVQEATAQGQVRLAGNELQFGPHLPRLTRARGTVYFSEAGFALNGAQARLLGGEVRAEGGTIAEPGATDATPRRLRVQGRLTAAGMRQETQLGALSRLAQHMSGSTGYTAELNVRQGVPEFRFETSLQGLALELPAPLRKPADTALPLRLQTQMVEGSAAAGVRGAAQDTVRLNFGRLLAVQYVRDLGSRPARVLRGGIAVGIPATSDSVPLPDAGVTAKVAFDELDLDAWSRLLTSPRSPPAPDADAASSVASDYLPTLLMARGERLTAGGQTFNDLVLDGRREGQTWRANADAREFSGYLEYRMPTTAGAGSVYARLARLTLAQEGSRGVETVLQEQPVNIPALDIVIENLELRGKKLGRAQIEALNRGAAQRDGGAPEWRLNKLALSMPEAEFSASGSWATFQELSEAPLPSAPPQAPASGGTGERRRTAMNFRIEVRDAGGLLTRLGMPGLVRAGKGHMEGQVSWVGSPMAVDYPSLGGEFSLNVETGQFLKADPGLAKLAGVLSLQSLPRRLTLDFRDVFSEGFAFDFVRGDVQVEQGVARTSNLQMKGVSAAVLMEGSADLGRETQDLRVVVVPEINAGTASLIAGMMNPVVGLSTFLAQIFLRGPVVASATQEFRVTGSWSDPRISKVDRRAENGSPGNAQ